MLRRILFLIFAIEFAAVSFAQVDRSKPPQPGPAPLIQLGKYDTLELANGLKVFVIENNKLPRVAFYLIINRTPILQNGETGYISAAGKLLGTATKTKTKDQINEQVDFIGASLSTSSSGVFAMSLKDHVTTLLDLMSDVVTNAVFKQSELDKIKLRMKSDLEASKDDPDAISSVVGDALRYGKNYPYGEVMTEKTIQNISLKKCEDYYSTYFHPNDSYLAVVGDISKDEAKSLVEKYFGDWQKGNIPKFSYKTPEPPAHREVAIVDRPNAVQSAINITYPVQLVPGSKDIIKASVMNTILGGDAFRLFQDLREDHGYTYGAYSDLSSDEHVGFFDASANVRNDVTDSSVTQILYEMNRIRKDKVSDEELQHAKNFISGNFAISLERPQTIASFAINIAKYNLPNDYYQNYLKTIAAVTPEDIQKEAGKYILPDNSYVLVVGNADQVAKGLTQFGSIKYYDTFGNLIDTTKASIPVGLTAEKIIDNYVNAIGGKENLRKVKDRTTVMSGSVQGMTVSMVIYQKAPDKMMQEVSAGAMKQGIYFNGKKGVMQMAGKSIEVKANELEKLRYESTLDLLTHLKSLGIKLKLEDIEKVNGKEAYKVDMILPSGTKWIQYYDTQTWLKVKESKAITVPQGTFTQDTYFDDYRDVDGVKYPFSLKQTLGPQHLDFIVTSIKVNTGLKDNMFEAK
ncbi:MAG: M16 family metallopeptidase [Ignavibacteriaceae bacterium]